MKLMNTDIADSPSNPDHVRLTGVVHYDTSGLKPESYWFEVPKRYAEFLSTTVNPWLACLLPLAVTLGEPLELKGEVDKRLYENAQTLMYIWKSWYSNLQVIPIEANVVDVPAVGLRHQKTAAFFSGGVDAFFTVLKHGDPAGARDTSIDHLLHVWGFDILIHDSKSYYRMLQMIRASADVLNKELVTLATNMRRTRLEKAGWGELYHGAAKATLGLLLENLYAKVLIPSSFAYKNIYPRGSTHLTDHLFSTTNTRFINDGDLSRYEKIQYIANSKVVQEQLHVCFMLENETNCCNCVKCCRTMINLELLGMLDKFKTFNRSQLTLDKIRRTISYDFVDRLNMKTLQKIAKEKGRDDIYQAIDDSFKHTDFIEFFWKPIRRLKTRHRTRKMAEALERMLLKNTLL